MYAYGLHVSDLALADNLIGPRALVWPAVTLTHVTAPAPDRTSVEGDDDRVTLLAEDYATVEVRRSDLRVTVVSPSPVPDDELVHPLLAFVGSVVARWTGRSAFHGASVVLNGRAWVLLAPPGGGKSTLSSSLSARGHTVLADDLTIVDGRTVLAGPRTCDLRAESARHLGVGRHRTSTDRQGRWRDELTPAPHEAPLGGFVSLGWGAELSVTPAGLRRKLELFVGNEALGRGPTSTESFLDLLDVPVLELVRPRSWDSLDATLDLLLDLTSS